MIETNELDPTYPVITYLLANHDNNWKGRFLLHYLWFYNLIDAIKAADNTSDETFWTRCYEDGAGVGVKRGGARRHFRAENARSAILTMEKKHMSPWEIICDMHKPRYHDLVAYIQSRYKNTQIGSYYIWKLMDWYDICLGWDVHLGTHAALKFMPDVPRDAAAEFFPDRPFKEVIEVMTGFVGQFSHPVKPYTACGISEVETILCGLHASFGPGKLAIGADINKQWAILDGMPELQEQLPARILGQYELGEYRYVA